MWVPWRCRRRRSWSLRSPVLQLSKKDAWTLGDAYEGTQIFGATGSGKTSGSGKAIAMSFLAHGFGGLVLTAKPGEREQWQRYCRAMGRRPPAVFRIGGPHRFNFLDYERAAAAEGGMTQNLVALFTEVLEAGADKSQRQNDAFWTNALEQLLRNAIDLVILGTDSLSLPVLYEVIQSAPQDPEDLDDGQWRETSACFRLISDHCDADRPAAAQRDFDAAARYFLREYPTLAEKTRSIIVAMFTGMAEQFIRGAMYDLFCTETTLAPEHAQAGAVIIIDLPVKTHHTVGRFAQVLWKYVFQRATERRDIRTSPRPLFLWADEAQFFVTRRDMHFQSTARSSRAATVYLTQNISNYEDVLGANKPAMESLLGSFQTKIFHANSGPTNQWAEDLIAKSWHTRSSTNFGPQGDDKRDRASMGFSDSLDPDVPAQAFTQLRCGGPQNDLLVEAILFKSGRRWHVSGSSAIKVTFKQQ